MKGVIVNPGRAGSSRLADLPDPTPAPGQAVVQVIAVGMDGTDRELLEGKYGEAPPGDDYLIIGHESIGRVISAPGGILRQGELVVPIVRRPDPEPCINCAAGEWDMCLNGRYTERGIKGAHGFLAERYVEDPRYLISIPEELAAVAVLLEPLSILEKAIEQIERIQSRLVWAPRRALVLGAGTIGTLAVLLLRMEGFDVYLYNRGDGGPGRHIAEAAGARFVSTSERELDHVWEQEFGPVDIAIEATGYSPLAVDAIHVVGSNGVVCLTGISSGSRTVSINASHLNLEIVLQNKVVFGTVNANRRHFESGVAHMKVIEGRWPGLLERMITSRIPLTQFGVVNLDQPSDLKVVVQVEDPPESQR